MVALNFHSSISHFVYRLIHNYGGMRLAHYFIYLVAFCTYEERDHALWDKNDDRKILSTYFLKDLVDVCEKDLTALVLLLHFFIINLF